MIDIRSITKKKPEDWPHGMVKDGIRPNMPPMEVGGMLVRKKGARKSKILGARNGRAGIAPNTPNTNNRHVTYTNVVNTYAQSDDIAKVDNYIKDNHSRVVVPDEPTYSIMSKCYAQKGHVGMGEDWCHDMVKEGNPPGVSRAEACGMPVRKRAELKRAKYRLREMERLDITLNHFSYNSKIYACAQKGPSGL